MIPLPFYKNKPVAVFGLGKAGMSAVRALAKSGAKLYVWDDGEAAREKLAQENFPNVVIARPESYDWTIMEALVLSPGIPLTHPKPHPVVEMAKKEKCPVLCDVELLCRAQSDAKFIGITGTNGKSTTTALTGHILQKAGVKALVGGNIGVPVLDLEPLGKDGVYVIELSSYQLDLIHQGRFHVGIWLNITPDHLDRHGDMAGYVRAKERLFMNQRAGDTVAIGVDDDYSRNVFSSLKNNPIQRNLLPVSVEGACAEGISIQDGVLYDKGQTYTIGTLQKLPGTHNAQNIAMAYAAARQFGIAPEEIIRHVHSFDGLPHRMQYVAEEGHVKFINDSKATNAEAAAKALGTFENIYWIAGGVPKAGGIDCLDEFFPRIKKAYLLGQAEEDFAKTLEGKVSYEKCATLANAFAAAKRDAANADGKNVVLLSPACASFDQWPNFEVRGEAFCKMVRDGV